MLSYISNSKIKDWKESFISNIEEKNLEVGLKQNGDILTNLKILSRLIIKKTRQFVPISSNLSSNEEERICSEIFVELTRVRGPKEEDKKFIEEIRNSPFDGTIKPTDSLFLSSLEKKMTYSAIWGRIMNNLPRNVKQRSTQEWLEFHAVKALKFGAGNCCEVAAVAFLLFLEYVDNINNIKIEEKIPIQRVSLVREDHMWIILNLNEKASQKEFSSWNDDTLFCDPWSEQLFTKKELLANLTKSELDTINQLFLNIKFHDSNFYVGEKHNTKPIHSERWMTKHRFMGKKFWRPLRLTDAKIPDTPKSNQPIRTPPLIALFSIEDSQQVSSVEIGELVVFLKRTVKDYELNIRNKEGKNVLKNPLPISKQDVIDFSKLLDDSAVINAILRHRLPRKRILVEAIKNEQLKLAESSGKSDAALSMHHKKINN